MRALRATIAGLLLGLTAACGSQPITVTGRVLDEKGTAIAKAEVFTEPETDVVMTNNRGFFQIRQKLNESGESETVPPGAYRIKVRKFGFDDLAADITIEAGPNKLDDLIMQPRTPDLQETAPDPTAEKERETDDTSTPVSGH